MPQQEIGDFPFNFQYYGQQYEQGIYRLSSYDISRTLLHLGMSGTHGIPVQDLTQVNRAVTMIPSQQIKTVVIRQLDRCDQAWENLNMASEPKYRASITTGDVNRSEVRFDLRESMRGYWEEYMTQTDLLANLLACPNYWNGDESRYRFERLGLDFISIPPEAIVADSSISDKLIFTDLISGSHGF